MRETMAGLPYKKHQALARESVRGSCKVSKNGCLNETISAEDELLGTAGLYCPERVSPAALLVEANVGGGRRVLLASLPAS